MDKFLQQLRDNLDNQPEPDYDHRDWEDMQQRLNPPTENSRKRVAGILTMAALLLLLLGMNGLTYFQLQQSNGKVQVLEQKLDTLIQTRIIYQTDTIYRDRIIIENNPIAESKPVYSNNQPTFIYQPSGALTNLIQKGSLASAQNNTPFFNQNNQEQTPFSNQILHSPFLDYQRDQLAQKSATEAAMIAEIRKRSIGKLALMDIPNLNAPDPKLPALTLPILEEEDAKKTARQLLYQLRPKGLEMGIEGGTIVLSDAESGSGGLRDIGLTANIKFSDNLQLWFSGLHRTFDYKSEEMGADYGIPVIPFPGDDFKFEGASVTRNGWQADVGMQYTFNAQKKWRPFLGAGFSLISLSKNEINYKFENEITDEYFRDNLTFSTPTTQNFFLLKGGLRYQFAKKWSANLAATYYHSIENTTNQVPNNFGLRAGVFYAF